MLNRVLHLVLIALGSLVGLSLCAPVHATTYPTFDLLSHSNTIGSVDKDHPYGGDYQVGSTPNTKISSIWSSNYDNYKGSADGYVIAMQGHAQAYSHATSPQYTDINNDFDPTDYAESTDRVTVTDIGPAPKGSTSITIKMQLTGSSTQAPVGADGSFAADVSASVQLIDASRSDVSAITIYSPTKYPALPHTVSATIFGVEGGDEIQVIYNLQAFTYINGEIYSLTGSTASDSLVDVSHSARIYIDTDNGAFIASNGYDYSSPAVPIPGTLLLFGTGLVGLAATRRRFNR